MNPSYISSAINSSRIHKEQTDKLLQYHSKSDKIESLNFYITPPTIPKSLSIRRQNNVHLPNNGALTDRYGNNKRENSINFNNIYMVDELKSTRAKKIVKNSDELKEIYNSDIQYDIKENIDDFFNISPNDNLILNNKKINFNKFILSMQFQVHELFPNIDTIIKSEPKLETTNIAINLLESLLISITNPTITTIVSRLFPIIKHSLYSPIPSYQPQNLNDFKVSSRLPYFCIVNDLQGVSMSSHKKLQESLNALADAEIKNENYENEIHELRESFDRKATRLELLERSEQSWHRKVVETQEQILFSKREVERLSEENNDLKHMTVRVRQGKGSGIEANPNILEKLNSLEKELASVRFSESIAKNQIEQLKKTIFKLTADRDELATKVDVVEQAMEMMTSNSDNVAPKSKVSSSSTNSPIDCDEENSIHERVETGVIRGRGLSDQIPIFLRYEGELRQFSFSKGEVEMLVKKIWALKMNSDQKGKELKKRSKFLDEFFHEYICDKFKEMKQIMEFSYNFVTALRIYKYDADCDLFYSCLFRELSEASYYDQMNLTSSFRKAVDRWILFDGKGRKNGTVDKEIFFSGLRSFFPIKLEQNMLEIRTITFNTLIDKGQNGVAYDKIFEESEDGDQHPFMEKIREQYLNELQEFCKAIWMKLSSSDIDKTGFLPAGQIEAILKELDPNKSSEEVRAYMLRGLSLQNYSVDLKVSLTIFYKALRLGGLVNKTGHYRADAQPAPAVTFGFTQ